MTRQASDFPTLALSRSGGTGISQPLQRHPESLIKHILSATRIMPAGVAVNRLCRYPLRRLALERNSPIQSFRATLAENK